MNNWTWIIISYIIAKNFNKRQTKNSVVFGFAYFSSSQDAKRIKINK